MDKMRMESMDITAQNIEKIAALFPNCITETADEKGRIQKAVNFEMLRQMLSNELAEGEESYEFTWVGKKASIVEASRPIRKTLRPCKAESVNWDTTENLYIEGDNLEVLKLLQESYLGRVKMIYIDPPYNTGNDFIYQDNFRMTEEEYAEESGEWDEDGNRMFRNTDRNGRFHSDWCSMIYPRLLLARNLLCEDGVIFISIDDKEIDNLSKMTMDVFGEGNFICKFIWKSKLGKVGTTATIASTHEYILCYAKNASCVTFQMIQNCSEGRRENLRQWGVADRREDRPSMWYPITIDGVTVYPIKEDGTDGRWRVGEDTAAQLLLEGVLELREQNGKYNIYRNFPSGISYTPYETLILDEIGTTAKGAKMLKSLELGKIFDFSKPVELVQHFAFLCTSKEDLVVDFFSGSAATAHAVMQLNIEDGGHRKFIMVQLPEQTEETSEAYKAGYGTICEIGKERIRRAAKKIRAENPNADFDGGFRVFKVDNSNMKDVYYAAGDYNQDMLDLLESNIKEDRTDLDLLFGCLLEWGLPLSMPYTSEEIDGCMIHTYNHGDLIACFDDNISGDIVRMIAKRQPIRAVFRDSSFSGSPDKINVGEIFKVFSPDSRVKVI